MKSLNNKIVIVYDGECPFCSNYVMMLNLKEVFEKVELVDARESDNSTVRFLVTEGYNLNNGMITIVNHDIYYGSDAVWILSKLTGGNRCMKYLFRSNKFTKLIYPLLRFVRFVTLKILKKKML